jgi:hypothetical protein
MRLSDETKLNALIIVRPPLSLAHSAKDVMNGLVGVDPQRRARAASTVTQFSQVGKGRISAEGIQLAYDLKQHLLGEVLGCLDARVA